MVNQCCTGVTIDCVEWRVNIWNIVFLLRQPYDSIYGHLLYNWLSLLNPDLINAKQLSQLWLWFFSESALSSGITILRHPLFWIKRHSCISKSLIRDFKSKLDFKICAIFKFFRIFTKLADISFYRSKSNKVAQSYSKLSPF